MISILAQKVQDEIVNKIHEAEFYSQEAEFYSVSWIKTILKQINSHVI